jgi:hypothetical protein
MTAGWLRSPAFDGALIGGVLALALALGGAAFARPDAFAAILLLDFWLLAYPHVAATFTRVAIDRGVRAHRFVLFALPPIVLAATASAAWLGGALLLNTVYFYWQTHHYTMQSFGIARAYHRASAARAEGGEPKAEGARDRLTDVVVLAFPIWGVLHRAEQAPAAFYGSPMWWPPMPRAIVSVAAAFAIGALALWTWRELRAERRGVTLFVLSHVVITSVSYVAIPDVTRGWLFINIWHNAQYLLFVWAMNARERDRARPFAWLGEPRHAWAYVAACLGVSSIAYLALGRALPRVAWQALPVVMVCHMAINFHHYLVDAVIWRTRRAPSRV